MAVAVFNNTTVEDLMREALRDLGKEIDDSTFDFIAEATYRRFILRHLDQETNWTFQKVYTGIWNYASGPIVLYGMTFEADDDTVYTVSADGSIDQTTGTDTRETIIVSACLINYNLLMSEFLFFLAANHAQDIATSVQGVSKSPNNIRKELMDMSAAFRGATGGVC